MCRIHRQMIQKNRRKFFGGSNAAVSGYAALSLGCYLFLYRVKAAVLPLYKTAVRVLPSSVKYAQERRAA